MESFKFGTFSICRRPSIQNLSIAIISKHYYEKFVARHIFIRWFAIELVEDDNFFPAPCNLENTDWNQKKEPELTQEGSITSK